VSVSRVVLVTRRFWPLVGGAERAMSNLATELASRDVDVTLLTARWQPHWPAELRYRGATVVRLGQPSLRVWGTIRYMQAIARWLRRHPDRYELICVSMLKHDAYAALGAAGGRVPVVLRAAGGGRSGDCVWQLDARCGRRIKRRCVQADAIVGPSRAIERELIAAGYPPDRVHRLANGVPIPEEPGVGRKAEARAALAAASPALDCPVSARLAVYTGRLDRAKGLGTLVAAWPAVLARFPDAQLWLAGEGPYGPDLREAIASRGLAGRVVLTGVFDSVDELLVAADLFVLPSLEEGMSVALLEAMAAGLPIVASDIPGNRDVATDGREALLVPVEEPRALAAAVLRVFEEPDLATRLGIAARQSAVERFSLAAMADRYLELFDRLLAAKSSKT
jgi:glycosyltransferase involved in cell wall biosynthesis